MPDANKKNLLSSRVKNDLLDLLLYGGYKKQDRIPAETELALRLNVSRSTLRTALDDLESDGSIKRVKGAGTFLNRDLAALDFRMERLFRLAELIEPAGLSLQTVSLKVESMKAGPKTAQKLDIDEKEEIIVFERVRSLEGVPAVYSVDRIPRFFLPQDYLIEDMGESLSAFLGIAIASSKSRVIPLKASGHLCEALQVAPDTLCLMLEEVTVDNQGRRIDYSHEVYLNHLFRFHVSRSKEGEQVL